MQEHAYPASHEPLIFSTGMAGTLNADAIEVQILHRLCHTAIPIDVHDPDQAARRVVAVEVLRNAVSHAWRVTHASRVFRPASVHLLNGSKSL